MQCLAEETVLQFLAGGLTPDQSASVDEHVDSCPACRQLLRFVAQGSNSNAETVPALGSVDDALSPTVGADGVPLPLVLDGGLPAGAKVGRYVVKSVLGKGGMGVVYAAFDPELDRKVAVKLLRPELAAGGGEAAAARLLREGRAIAKLAHPNVVTVFDVGAHDGAVFVAMELVVGRSLDVWIHEQPRPWRDVVALFLQAGAGLDAAHAAGMVHRDFKPANVLVGNDGRARVTDFGLARLGAEGERPSRPSGQLVVDADNLTRTGAVMGTPAYMAPEQFEAGEVDAKTDQFSFAVSLYEALYGERPFAGATASELYANILDESVRAPSNTTVPAWLRQIVLRGMRCKRDDRYPTLDAMLVDLRFDPGARRRRIAIGAGAAGLVAAGALAFVFAGGDRAPDCSRAGDAVATAWSDPIEQRLAAALAASKIPGAVPIGAQASAMLDDYAEKLRAQRVTACKAHHVEHTRSQELFDAQMRCLDQRVASTRTLVDTLTTKPDATSVAKATDAVLALPALQDCEDDGRLRARHGKHADAKQRAQLEAAERTLSRADSLFSLGNFPDALALVTQAETEASGHAGTLARASCARGNMENARSRHTPALEAYDKCAELSAEAGDDAMLAEAWISAMGIEGFQFGRTEAALARVKMVEHAMTRAGRPKDLVARFHFVRANILDRAGDFEAALADHDKAHTLYTALGNMRAAAKTLNGKAAVYYAQGAYDKALTYIQDAARIRKQVYGPLHPEVLESAQNVALILDEMGKREESIKGLETALAETETALGNHSFTAQAAHNLAAILGSAGKYERALELHQKGLAVRRAVYGEEHIDTATSYELVGGALIDLGRIDDAAKSVETAIAIARRVLPPNDPKLAFNLYSLARVHFGSARYDLALPLIKEVVAIRDAQKPPMKQHLATAVGSLGLIAKHLGKWDEACPAFERAQALRTEVSGPDSPELTTTLIGRANCAAADLKWDEAEKHAQRALEIDRGAKMLSPVNVAATELEVASIYWANPKWRGKAVALEAVAEKRLAGTGEAGAHVLEKLVSWRKKRAKLK